MSNLRNLLYTPTGTSVSNRYTANGNGDDTQFTGYSNLNKTGSQLIFTSWCQYVPDSTNYQHCMAQWCAPTGTTEITFEIWGSGGGGAGSCCCQQGQPGGSGAYAKKTVYGTLGGCKYGLLLGYTTDCSPTCCGYLGCSTYVTGYGLTNFCAEGGFGGKSCCFTFWGNYTCAGNTVGNVRLCYTEADCRCYYGADTGAPGRPGFLWSQCSCYPCNWKQAIPYPGGLVNQGGGHVLIRTQGDACIQEWLKCAVTIGYSADTNGQFVPGIGGPTSTSCAGSCCYGQSGGPGMIKITYR